MPDDVNAPVPAASEAAPVSSASEPDRLSFTADWMFGTDYVRQVLRWSIVLAALAGVVGWLITTQIAFALGLWIGAAVDIATFRELAQRGALAIEGQASNLRPVAALLVRLAAKAVLLLAALAVPWHAAFWGVFGGVLVVEFMVVVVGIARSSTTMLRTRGGSGKGAKS